MTNDEQIKKLSVQIDEFFLKLLQEYEISPLNLSAVISGRVYMLNESLGTSDDFKRLLEEILVIPATESIPQNTNIH